MKHTNRTMRIARWAALCAAAGLLSACAVMPDGPSVMALPGTGKTFDQFRADDYSCRQYATQQIGGTNAAEASTVSGVGSAIVGTALGAAAGAAFGGHNGAAVGAGAGLLAGSLFGTSNAQASGYTVQRRYDFAYTQCMYAAGERVPMSARMQSMQQQGYYPQQQGYQNGGYAPPPLPPSGYSAY